jgi:hypothetical protein
MTSTSSKYPSAFWERLWLMSGIEFIAFFVIAYLIYGFQPQVGAQPDDLAWSCVVLSSFPRAMLIMSGTFGLWRAGLISNALFATEWSLSRWHRNVRH